MFNILQIVISAILIVIVLLQVKGSGFGAALGGMSGGGTFRTKRGLEKTLFQATIILSIVFIFISFLSVESQR
ncbi:MAG: preprotein translocase subunit SecG [Dehalococcoidia bacterium]|nr:preprotein translocase subunit SecG [Dehalococcoidia bacterium]MCB9484832.1 preprotein translocase subunit SecG [Thermoflexaceae bacterium]